VERDDMIHHVPIDMDDDTMDDHEEDGNGGGNDPKQVQQDQPTPRNSSTHSSAGDASVGSKQTQHGKTVPVHIPTLEELQGIVHGATKDGEEVPSGDEAPYSDPSSPIMQDVLMAAIPEAETPGRRSKHRAETVDESSMERAERIKAACNLDFQGNSKSPQPTSILFSDEEVLNNLGVVGISLGQDKSSVTSSWNSLRQVELDRMISKQK
jgi:hypothetical protein